MLPLIGNPLLFLVALAIGVARHDGDRRRPEVDATRHARRGRRERHRSEQGAGLPTRPSRATPPRPDSTAPTRHLHDHKEHAPWHSAPSPSPRPSGLHARPAALFVQAATATGLHVEIARDGEDAGRRDEHPRRHGPGAKHGEQVVLTADGDGADDALDGLVALLSRDLDAEE